MNGLAQGNHPAEQCLAASTTQSWETTQRDWAAPHLPRVSSELGCSETHGLPRSCRLAWNGLVPSSSHSFQSGSSVDQVQHCRCAETQMFATRERRCDGSWAQPCLGSLPWCAVSLPPQQVSMALSKRVHLIPWTRKLRARWQATVSLAQKQKASKTPSELHISGFRQTAASSRMCRVSAPGPSETSPRSSESPESCSNAC
mmetsp:Transcript_6494/g.18186  ORF Transcript_6494/g.18186 Transcript_6494/m.18186 type:complete len:201 (-) Transcript_6494:1598-2200(-)